MSPRMSVLQRAANLTLRRTVLQLRRPPAVLRLLLGRRAQVRRPGPRRRSRPILLAGHESNRPVLGTHLGEPESRPTVPGGFGLTPEADAEKSRDRTGLPVPVRMNSSWQVSFGKACGSSGVCGVSESLTRSLTVTPYQKSIPAICGTDP